jgi:hypothetical protein
MEFRSRFLVEPFYIQGNAGPRLTVLIRSPRDIQVTFTRPETVGLERDYAGQAYCEAHSEFSPNHRVGAALVALSERSLPDGLDQAQESECRKWLDKHDLEVSTEHLPARFTPGYVRDFAAQLSRELFVAASYAAQLLMWRYALGVGHRPLSGFGRGVEYSLDGERWFLMPANIEWRVSMTPYIYPDAEVRKELQRLIDEDISPPVAHFLLQEAVGLLESNPRSSLFAGVAALEIGVKSFLATMLPDARWLLENLPSPPVKGILKEYLPRLPCEHTRTGRCISPPGDLLREIEHAVSARNRSTHVTGDAPPNETISRWLNAIGDTLRLLEWQQGHTWALELISPETRTSLGLGPETAP